MLRSESASPLPLSSIEYIICSEFGWDHWQFLGSPPEVIANHLAHIGAKAEVSNEKSGSRSGPSRQRGGSASRDEWESALRENEESGVLD